MMKKYKFFMILFTALASLLCGCKDNTLDSSEILRRIRMRNTPDDVMTDLVAALQKGKAKELYALSTDRLQDITENAYLLEEEEKEKEKEINEIMKRGDQYLKKHYSNWLLSSKPVKKEKKYCIYDLIMQDPDSKEIKTIQVKLILDPQKNWKNDTRF